MTPKKFQMDVVVAFSVCARNLQSRDQKTGCGVNWVKFSELDYNQVTYLSMFSDFFQGCKKIFSEFFDIFQVIFHGVRQVHQIVEIHWITFNSFKRYLECVRRTCKNRETTFKPKLHQYQFVLNLGLKPVQSTGLDDTALDPSG